MTDGRVDYWVEAEDRRVTFVYLFEAGSHALEHGQKDLPGCAYFFMAACVFAAFSAEAYFNHIGGETIEGWEEHFERLTPIGKAILLNQRLLLRPVDFGARPYQSLRDAVRYRNALAHGKTLTARAEGVQRLRPWEDAELPTVKWQPTLQRGVAERLMVDVEEIITTMHKALGGVGHPLSDLGGSSWLKQIPSRSRVVPPEE